MSPHVPEGVSLSLPEAGHEPAATYTLSAADYHFARKAANAYPRLVAALEKRCTAGHSDTCYHTLIPACDCTCGQHEARALLRELEQQQ